MLVKVHFKEFLDKVLDDDYGIPDSAIPPLHRIIEHLFNFKEGMEIINRIKCQDGRWSYRKVDE